MRQSLSWLARPRPYRAALLVIFVGALLLRVGVAVRFQGLGAPPNISAAPDQADYEALAHHLSIGRGYTTSDGSPTARRTPGTSFALLPAYFVTGRSYAFGRLWFCLLSALTCVATAWTARLAFGPITGLAAAAWLGLYPGHFYYAMHFVSEVPYALALALACALTLDTLRASSRPGWRDVAAGASWAAAILARAQLAFAVPVAALIVLVAGGSRRRRLIGHLAVQTVVVAFLLAPWMVRNDRVMGKLTLSTVGGHTFWGGNNEVALLDPSMRGLWVRTSDLADARHSLAGTEVEREAATWRYGLRFVKQHLDDMPGLIAAKLHRLSTPFEDTPNRAVYWSFALSWTLTAPFATLGLVVSLRHQRLAAAVLGIPLLATVVTTMIFYGSIRFRDSVAPVFVTLAAHGVVQLGEYFGVCDDAPAEQRSA